MWHESTFPSVMQNNSETKRDKASEEATAFENPLDQITEDQKKELKTVGEKAEHWHDRGALVRAEIRFALTEDGSTSGFCNSSPSRGPTP